MQLPDVVLYRPEIPPNTGNVIRLCANTGAQLHLIGPLGFELSDRHLRRAGLDYAELAQVYQHSNLSDYLAARPRRTVFALTRHARRRHVEVRFGPDDALLFGPETTGLPSEVLAPIPEDCRLRLPMRQGSRSMNLANSVAVTVYEAWRQADFDGAV
jgi:tRNA (cytidine/uridine-2'-O-)-methyltransferase